MFRNVFIFLCLVFFTACNSQKSTNDENKQVDNEISSEKIKVFMRERNFDIVATAKLVVAFDIQKTLISGTTDEYSNKVVLKDTLQSEKSTKLLTLLKDDTSYDWESTEDQTSFNPSRQILVKNDNQRIFLLVDEEAQKLGFINLEGQKVVKLSSNLLDYLKNL